jgi:hypothetical protein
MVKREQKRMVCLVAICLLVGSVAPPLVAQEKDVPAPENDAVAQETDAVRDPEAEAEALAAYLIASSPGPEHQRLASLEGSWAVTGRFWTEPGSLPITAVHSASLRMDLGGRYLIEELEGALWGEEFRGLGITAFDNVAEEYVTTWIDNMSTGILILRGTYDRDSDAVVMRGEYTDPVTQQTRSLRSVERITPDGARVYEHWELAADGTEYKVMELTYRRKRAP